MNHLLIKEENCLNKDMGLRELDKEYAEMAHFSSDEKIRYCEDLIIRMRKRLADDYSDTGNMHMMIVEMIESAEIELQTLIIENNKKK